MASRWKIKLHTGFWYTKQKGGGNLGSPRSKWKVNIELRLQYIYIVDMLYLKTQSAALYTGLPVNSE